MRLPAKAPAAPAIALAGALAAPKSIGLDIKRDTAIDMEVFKELHAPGRESM
jgi:hypothetical protein